MLIGACAGTAGSLFNTLIVKRSISQQWHCHPGPTAELVPLGLLRCDRPPGWELLGQARVSASCRALEASGSFVGLSLLLLGGLGGNPRLGYGHLLNPGLVTHCQLLGGARTPKTQPFSAYPRQSRDWSVSTYPAEMRLAGQAGLGCGPVAQCVNLYGR